MENTYIGEPNKWFLNKTELDIEKELKKMENNKYYIPTIEEIKVGFELQYHNFSRDEAGIPELNYDRWDTVTLKEDDVKLFMEYGIKGGIRVKYLDREDIEGCGWKYDANTSELEYDLFYIEPGYDDKNRFIQYSLQNYKNGKIYLDKCINSGVHEIGFLTIRNKSELKTLMKWLNII